MNALLNYPGAKWGMAKEIVALMPPHKSYLEPFFGSGAVLFNKPPSAIETVNDIDGDITKFFYHIAHEQLKEIVAYHFGYDPDILWLCNLYIDSTEGDGIPLGNQINQGFALLYLDGMDKLIKYQLGIEYYGRNMDDFWLIHPSKEYLQYCLEVITAYLETLNLTLNGKTQIFPFKNGVNYLGFHTYVTEDGKVIRKLSNQKKRNAQRKYTKMAKLVVAGKLPLEKLETSYTSHKAHRSHGNCYQLGKSMDYKIAEILQKGEGE